MTFCKKAIIVCVLAVGLLFVVKFAGSQTLTVSALTTQEKLDKAKEEKKQTEAALSQTQDDIKGMQGKKSSLQVKLSGLNDSLEEVSENLAQLESDIDVKLQEIEDTKAELEQAEKTEAEQYASMKMRIRYMYERRDYTYLEILNMSGGIGEFLNKSIYIEKLSEYDQKKLEEYKETRASIEETKAQLEEEKEELLQLQEETEAEKAKVSGLVAATANNIADYADQIADAEADADAYKEQMKEQEANIAALQKQLAEELAKSKLAKNSVWRDISQVSFDEGDRELLAELIYCEAGGEPYAGKVAVGAVVINRVLSGVFPDTVVGVIYQRKQFAPVLDGHLALALANHRANSDCYSAADEAMRGMTNVGQCVFFRTPIPGLVGLQIGNHIFY